MGYKKLMLFILLLSIICSACSLSPGSNIENSAEASNYHLSFDEILTEINARHEAVAKPIFVWEEFEAKFVREKETREFKLEKSRGSEKSGYLSVEQMKRDAYVLIHTLRTGYSMYDFYGGDTKFDAVLKEIEVAVDSIGEMTPQTFCNLLRRQLSFIDDRHFTIGGLNFAPVIVTAFYREEAFGKTDGKYFNLRTGQEVKSVDGWPELNSLFRLSLSDDCQLVYYPVVQKSVPFLELHERYNSGVRMEAADTLKVTYNDNSTQTIPGFMDYRGLYDTSSDANIHITKGIPVFTTTAFDDSVQKNKMRQFADSYDHNSSIIVDLRGNSGGNATGVFQWFKHYTNHAVNGNSYTVYFGSMRDLYSNLSYSEKSALEENDNCQVINDTYVLMEASEDIFINNPNRLLVVLMSKSTASAAEIFVDCGHNIENVIFVGDASCGALSNNSFYFSVKLPHSYIPFSIGKYARVFPGEEYFREGRGFLPDIWVPSVDAEELICGYLQKLQKQ